MNLGNTKTKISGKTYTHVEIMGDILLICIVKELEVTQSFELDATIDTKDF